MRNLKIKLIDKKYLPLSYSLMHNVKNNTFSSELL